MNAALIVIAKAPRPGASRRGCARRARPSEAARARRAPRCADTLDAVLATPAARRVLVARRRARSVAAAPGSRSSRSAAAASTSASRPPSRTSAGRRCWSAWTRRRSRPRCSTQAWTASCADGTDAVLGPAHDGGYWAIGLRAPRPRVFRGVPMSSRATPARAQRARLRRARPARRRSLPPLRDVDHDRRRARGRRAWRPAARFAAALRGRPASHDGRRRGVFGLRSLDARSARARCVRDRARRRPRAAARAWTAGWRPGRASTSVCSRRADGPVLDVGCGPGRHVRALRPPRRAGARRRRLPRRGRASPARRGATGARAVDLRSPAGAGSWGTRAAARRQHRHRRRPGTRCCGARRDCSHAGGAVLVELDPPGVGLRRDRVRLEHGDARRVTGSPGRGSASTRVDGPRAARRASRVAARWRDGDRWFAARAAGAA